MSLTKNGIPFAEVLPTNDINEMVFCMESTVIPPYSNGYVQCKMFKRNGRAYIGRSCVLEPSFRHRSLYSHCNTYEGLVTVDDNIVSSGVFNIVMTNTSNKHIKIHNNQTMEMFLFLRTVRFPHFTKLWHLTETPGSRGTTNLMQTPQKKLILCPHKKPKDRET